MYTIQLDVDGVLAGFTEAFLHLASVYYPEAAKVDPQSQTSFGECGGINLWDERTWDLLKSTPWWWCSLHPLVFGDEFVRIAKLCRWAKVYFVTNRMHEVISPTEQTAAWLRIRGVPHPNVVCMQDKGLAAEMLGTSFSLEDRLENAEAIDGAMGYVEASYLLDRPYNQGRPYMYRVPTVAAFLDIVEAAL